LKNHKILGISVFLPFHSSLCYLKHEEGWIFHYTGFSELIELSLSFFYVHCILFLPDMTHFLTVDMHIDY